MKKRVKPGQSVKSSDGKVVKVEKYKIDMEGIFPNVLNEADNSEVADES